VLQNVSPINNADINKSNSNNLFNNKLIKTIFIWYKYRIYFEFCFNKHLESAGIKGSRFYILTNWIKPSAQMTLVSFLVKYVFIRFS